MHLSFISSVLLKIRNVSSKLCTENQEAYSVFSSFR